MNWFRPLLHRSTTHDSAEDTLSILQLCNAVLQELSLALRAGGLRGDCFDFVIRQAVDNDRGEYFLQTADHVALDDLGSYVGNEGLLRDLDHGCD